MEQVNSPSHYQIKLYTTSGDFVEIEVVDIMEALFSTDLHLSQAFKYMARADHKGSYEQDCEKAAWWLNRAVSYNEGATGIRASIDIEYI